MVLSGDDDFRIIAFLVQSETHTMGLSEAEDTRQRAANLAGALRSDERQWRM